MRIAHGRKDLRVYLDATEHNLLGQPEKVSITRQMVGTTGHKLIIYPDPRNGGYKLLDDHKWKKATCNNSAIPSYGKKFFGPEIVSTRLDSSICDVAVLVADEPTFTVGLRARQLAKPRALIDADKENSQITKNLEQLEKDFNEQQNSAIERTPFVADDAPFALGIVVTRILGPHAVEIAKRVTDEMNAPFSVDKLREAVQTINNATAHGVVITLKDNRISIMLELV